MNKATKRQIIRRSEKEKLELIEQWENSGLSIKAFCHQHQFSDSLFHSWLNKYRRYNKKAPTHKSAFMPVQVTAPSPITAHDPPAPYAEVILKDGSRIKLYRPVSVEYLRTLVA